MSSIKSFACFQQLALPKSWLPTKNIGDYALGVWTGYGKKDCIRFNFLLESKPSFLSKKYARRFLWGQMWPIVTAMIV
jgi:hypothetical protein